MADLSHLGFYGSNNHNVFFDSTTSYRSSIETIGLNCLVLEKIAFFAFWWQTDKRTEKQMDNVYALSRSRCRERRLNKLIDWLIAYYGPDRRPSVCSSSVVRLVVAFQKPSKNKPISLRGRLGVLHTGNPWKKENEDHDKRSQSEISATVCVLRKCNHRRL